MCEQLNCPNKVTASSAKPLNIYQLVRCGLGQMSVSLFNNNNNNNDDNNNGGSYIKRWQQLQKHHNH